MFTQEVSNVVAQLCECWRTAIDEALGDLVPCPFQKRLGLGQPGVVVPVDGLPFAFGIDAHALVAQPVDIVPVELIDAARLGNRALVALGTQVFNLQREAEEAVARNLTSGPFLLEHLLSPLQGSNWHGMVRQTSLEGKGLERGLTRGGAAWRRRV